MTKNLKYTALCLFVTLLAIACSTDGGDSSVVTNPNEEKKEIRIQTNVTSVQNGTRATTIDSNTELQGQNLKIDAYYHDTETKYLDGTTLHYDATPPAGWKFWVNEAQTHYYWPIEGSVYDPSSTNITVSSLDFVGYCPYTRPGYITAEPTYNHSTGISFSANMASFMTNSNQADVKEFMCAIASNRTAAGGAVPLEFKHPFALIKFVIAEGSGTHVQVNSISISGLNTNATCTYNGSTISWGSHPGSASMTITPDTPLKYGTTSTETTPFIVIPNTYVSKTLTVNGTWDDWSDVSNKDISTDISINWEPGYIYTYNLTVTKYALTVKTDKYTEQW